MWDGQSRVYIDVPPTFYDNTKGLCGTYTNNQNDDFLTNEGDIEQDSNAFANKWKTSDECTDVKMGDLLQDACEIFPQRREIAQLYCSKLKSDIFSSMSVITETRFVIIHFLCKIKLTSITSFRLSRYDRSTPLLQRLYVRHV